MANINVETIGGFAGIGWAPTIPNLKAVAAPTVGNGFIIGATINNFTVQCITTASPTFSVKLQGSLDGATWVDIGSPITSTGLTTFLNVCVPYVRLNLTALSGGTFTGWVCGV